MEVINDLTITAQPFNKLWLTKLDLKFPTGRDNGFLSAWFSAYDGIHLLSNTVRPLVLDNLKDLGDEEFAAMLNALRTEIDRLSGGQLTKLEAVRTFASAQGIELDTAPLMLTVIAVNPPSVRAVVTMVFGLALHIDDCFALAAVDPTFAQVLGGTLTEIARQAGLSMQ